MTSPAQTGPPAQSTSYFDRPLSSVITLNWELVLYGLILLLAIATRFYDLDARAFSHDGAQHAFWSHKLYDGDGYRHDPLMHGPFLFHVTAFSLFLLGDNDFAARAGLALFGVILVMLPIGFRP